MAWTRTDDLDGTSPAEQVTFGWNGKLLTIDLSEANLAKLTEAVTPFADAAVVVLELPSLMEAPTPDAAYRLEFEQHLQTPDLPTPPAPAASARRTRVKTNGAKKGERTEPTQSEVRLWAKANGISVISRGRVSKDVIEQYKAAHA